MSNEDRDNFKKEFKKEIERGGPVEIKESVSKSFEAKCVSSVSSYANKAHDWRNKSLHSTLFII